MLTNQNQLGAGKWWRFRHFKKTLGYANAPLDGVWARAPYLHNGSVPTLYDLFSRPCAPEDWAMLGLTGATDLKALAKDPARVAEIIESARKAGLRPPVFYRGDDAYDPVHVGFRCDRAVRDDGHPLFLYSTVSIENGQIAPLAGNEPTGHVDITVQGNTFDFGSGLSSAERWAIIEYQKMLGQKSGGQP
ncbi:MAG: hypothetical protein IT423_17570 [Pirellulaceae bacterium]|nr:hypothetical protein [Pirellulaceae bacterium]